MQNLISAGRDSTMGKRTMLGMPLVAALFASAAWSATPTEVCDLHFSSGVVLEAVPIAQTREQQAQGLMNRDDVGNGMLFAWQEADLRAFWMRDTRVPLSIGFFGADGALFAIRDMEPETDDHHFSARPAKDALELAQGEFERKGVEVGSRLIRRDCRPISA